LSLLEGERERSREADGGEAGGEEEQLGLTP